MASFVKAIPTILKHEGGWVNNANDPGGATKYGISLRFLKENKLDLDGDGDIDADDVKGLTTDRATMLYYDWFWVPGRFELVKDQLVATKLFDMGVNMGPRQGWRLAQKACNKYGLNLTVDGLVGPQTMLAVNALEPTNYIKTLCDTQKEFYDAIIVQNPKLEEFRKGWYYRAGWPLTHV